MRSWKTTVFGICTIGAALCAVGKSILDGDPLTNPDWGTTIAAITAGIGLIFGKDASVTGPSTPV